MADECLPSGLDRQAVDSVTRLIYQRRSIRRYRPEPLPEAWVEQMLACAHQAPSPSNSQPVRYVRIDSPACREKLRQALVEGHAHLIARHKAVGGPAQLRNRINAYRRYAEFMFAAPVLLAVGAGTGTKGFSQHLAEAGLIERDMRQTSDLDMTVGLALKGLMLKAQAMGVGSCVLTAPLVFIENVERLLGLKDMQVKCFVTLGLADEVPKPTPRSPLEDVYTVI
jgi:nitroreductase